MCTITPAKIDVKISVSNSFNGWRCCLGWPRIKNKSNNQEVFANEIEKDTKVSKMFLTLRIKF